MIRRVLRELFTWFPVTCYVMAGLTLYGYIEQEAGLLLTGWCFIGYWLCKFCLLMRWQSRNRHLYMIFSILWMCGMLSTLAQPGTTMKDAEERTPLALAPLMLGVRYLIDRGPNERQGVAARRGGGRFCDAGAVVDVAPAADSNFLK